MFCAVSYRLSAASAASVMPAVMLDALALCLHVFVCMFCLHVLLNKPMLLHMKLHTGEDYTSLYTVADLCATHIYFIVSTCAANTAWADRLPERIRPSILAFGGVADGFLPFEARDQQDREVQLKLASIVMKAVQV